MSASTPIADPAFQKLWDSLIQEEEKSIRASLLDRKSLPEAELRELVGALKVVDRLTNGLIR